MDDLAFAERFVGIFAILLGSAFFFYGIPKVSRGKAPSGQSWIWFLVIAAAIATVLLLVPAKTSLVTILAALSLMGGALLVGLIDMLWRRASAARAQSRARVVARDGPESFERIHTDPPPEFEPHAVAFERLGYQRVKYGTRGDGTQLVMFRSSDSIVAEITSIPKVKAIWAFELLDLTSVLSGRRGLLTTTNVPTHQRLWHGELLQVFPGMGAVQLAESHEAALALLADRGVTTETFDESAIEEFVRWGLQMLSMAQAGARSRDLLWRKAPTEVMKSLHVGALQDDPRLDELVAALPGAAEL